MISSHVWHKYNLCILQGAPQPSGGVRATGATVLVGRMQHALTRPKPRPLGRSRAAWFPRGPHPPPARAAPTADHAAGQSIAPPLKPPLPTVTLIAWLCSCKYARATNEIWWPRPLTVISSLSRPIRCVIDIPAKAYCGALLSNFLCIVSIVHTVVINLSIILTAKLLLLILICCYLIAVILSSNKRFPWSIIDSLSLIPSTRPAPPLQSIDCFPSHAHTVLVYQSINSLWITNMSIVV